MTTAMMTMLVKRRDEDTMGVGKDSKDGKAMNELQIDD